MRSSFLYCPLNFDSFQRYLYQLLKGIEWMHGKGLLHRDIKPSNVVLHPVHKVLKLCDFGTASNITKEHEGGIGTIQYWAPELLFNGRNIGAPIGKNSSNAHETVSVSDTSPCKFTHTIQSNKRERQVKFLRLTIGIEEQQLLSLVQLQLFDRGIPVTDKTFRSVVGRTDRLCAHEIVYGGVPRSQTAMCHALVARFGKLKEVAVTAWNLDENRYDWFQMNTLACHYEEVSQNDIVLSSLTLIRRRCHRNGSFGSLSDRLREDS